VQVRQLREKRRNELENLLSIFDQDNITDNEHILNIDESRFTDEHRHIIRKLREAYESRQVRGEMQIEDDYLNELLMKDEVIAKQDKSLEEKDKTIAEKDKTIEEKDRSLAEKDKTIEEKDKSLAEKDKSLADSSRENEQLRNEQEKLKRQLENK
jgi:DNA repair exonuclease SbcCD ATPase subunit